MSSRYQRREPVMATNTDEPEKLYLAPPHPKYAPEIRECSATDLWSNEGTMYVRGDKMVALAVKQSNELKAITAMQRELARKLDAVPAYELAADTMGRGLAEVCKVTVAYLTGEIDAEEAMTRIIAETDNREISPFINQYQPGARP